MRKFCDEKQAWFEKAMNDQTKRKLYEDPSLLAADIHSNRKSLDTFCFSILRKPKPAAPAPPAADAAKADAAKADAAKANSAKANANGADPNAKASEKMDTQADAKANAKAGVNGNDMDID